MKRHLRSDHDTDQDPPGQQPRSGDTASTMASAAALLILAAVAVATQRKTHAKLTKRRSPWRRR